MAAMRTACRVTWCLWLAGGAAAAPRPRGDGDDPGWQWESGGSASGPREASPGWEPMLWLLATALGVHAALVALATGIARLRSRPGRGGDGFGEEAIAQLCDFGHIMGTCVIFVTAALVVPMLTIASGGSVEALWLMVLALGAWRLRSYVLTLEHWRSHGIGAER